MSDSPVLAGDVVGPGVRRIAEALALPYSTVRGLVDRGLVPTFKLGTRRYGRLSEMAAALTANLTESQFRALEPEPARGRAGR